MRRNRDTAGMERCMTGMAPAFFRGVDVVCLCFDLTERKGFENLENWRNLFYEHSRATNPNAVPMLVLGNKADLVDQRQVRADEVRRWCRERGDLQYFEVSAKDDVNVGTAMRAATCAALAALEQDPDPPIIPEVPTLVLGRSTATNNGPCSC